MLVAEKLMTADEFLRQAPQDKRNELVHEEMIVLDPAGWEHGDLAGRMLVVLHNFVTKQNLGECSPQKPDSSCDTIQIRYEHLRQHL